MGRALPVEPEARLAHCVASYGRTAHEYARRTGELMADELAAFARTLRTGSAVLDAGCGPGRDLARFVAAGLSPVGVDLTPEFVEMAQRVAPVVCADVRALPMVARSFDAVWACASLVHLDRSAAKLALAELGRVARRGAPGYVCVKTGESGWRSKPGETRRWYQGWTHGELESALEAAGWSVARITVSEEWVTAHTRRGAQDLGCFRGRATPGGVEMSGWGKRGDVGDPIHLCAL